MKRSWKRTRIWRRLVSGLLTAVMLVTMLPTEAYAALLDNTPDQNRQILEELTAFWGDEKTAQEAMELLRQYGLIDEEGNILTDWSGKISIQEESRPLTIGQARAMSEGDVTVNGRACGLAELNAVLDGMERLGLLVEAMGATGIRVSEVRYLTVEAARQGKAEISLKGKIRTILLPGKLRRKLLKYAQKQKIASGAIFRTRSGRELSRRQIWAELKGLCKHACVEPSKVFPHNLRHLFATVFYQVCRDIVKLADLLGHSSIETTRIYLVTSGSEHQRALDRLGLVS